MILTELKTYLAHAKTATLFELGTRFAIDTEVLRHMLQYLIQKGKVRKAEQPAGCGTQCSKCAPTLREIYQWQE